VPRFDALHSGGSKTVLLRPVRLAQTSPKASRYWQNSPALEANTTALERGLSDVFI
jgi:hypothetical protein